MWPCFFAVAFVRVRELRKELFVFQAELVAAVSQVQAAVKATRDELIVLPHLVQCTRAELHGARVDLTEIQIMVHATSAAPAKLLILDIVSSRARPTDLIRIARTTSGMGRGRRNDSLTRMQVVTTQVLAYSSRLRVEEAV